ncbi:hypothetical protein IST4116A_02352 [Burkholderia cenocepacia]|uniref:Uncharacterized protein n=1 Tax=Burkholderia phage AP3 TaxID=1636201 RepID=A0A1S5NNB0_9CAUD|nr:hypothetical protein [Burkholderia cenocepacia]YP_009785102.1 hypothetical protein HOR03_gp11 [Burkholderia phage AP3]AKA61133.1 hypothetical protein vB_BceM_AP3_0011 [Burkholderia phage AP3]CAB5080229.1 hypothetical protein IST4129_02376 [Burkholderia cenocepacia]CAB5090474.1 hypothetical protein IST4116A_02352 [Burkholderia cenocepacia]CAB5094115.1 hypothetical protein IST4134_04711 [Burkholderia cenocepacia]CAB5096502.1 hypothetical protein IST4131_02370 [Burkholderia cenocepacia]
MRKRYRVVRVDELVLRYPLAPDPIDRVRRVERFRVQRRTWRGWRDARKESFETEQDAEFAIATLTGRSPFLVAVFDRRGTRIES